jgi:hypothetical protein
MAAQLAPSRNDYLEAGISISATGSPLTAKTRNIASIRSQIQKLYSSLHGSSHDLYSDAVTQVYEIFVAALSNVDQVHSGTFYQCNIGRDGTFYDDNLTKAEIESFRYTLPGEDWWQENWEIRNVFQNEFRSDLYGTKYAWTAVMMYMLSHYDYLHE